MNTKNGGLFRIVRSKPHGRTEPGHIRTASIGLVLPIDSEVDGYYVVRRDVFIQKLAAVGTDEARTAARWWRQETGGLLTWRARRFNDIEVLLFPKEDTETIECRAGSDPAVPTETQLSFIS